MRKTKIEKGITLVALIITMVMLTILASVSIGAVQNAGLIGEAKDVESDVNRLNNKKENMLSGMVDYLNGNNSAPEDVFIWKSDDPNDEGYRTIIGYTANADNYVTLGFPERCTKIQITYLENLEEDPAREMRRYTGNIREVELPNTVVEIGEGAFSDYEFDSLQKINIPKSVKSIGDYAFEGCHNLTSINYEGTIEEWEKITKGNGWNSNMFASYIQCTDGIYPIMSNFEGTDYDVAELFIWESSDPNDNGYGELVGYTSNVLNYTTLTIPNRCERINIDGSVMGEVVIRSFTQNIKEIELPNTITEIGEGSFSCYYFYNVEKFTFDGSVTEWENIAKAYNWNDGLVVTQVQCSDGTVDMENGGTYYPSGDYDITDLFIYASDDPNDEGYGTIVGYTANVQNYTTLIIPERCTKIEQTYFEHISDEGVRRTMRAYTENIKEVELPNTITEIGYQAFGNSVGGSGYNFGGLKKINIPRSVKKIEEYAFYNCTVLTSITYEGPRNEWESISKGALWNDDVPAAYVQCLDGVIYLD